jgi:hypothetical protein
MALPNFASAMTNVQKHVTLQGLVGPVFKTEQTQEGSVLSFVLYCQNAGGVKHTKMQIYRMQAVGPAAGFLSEYLKSGQRIAVDAMPVSLAESGAGPQADAAYLVVDFLLLNSG